MSIKPTGSRIKMYEYKILMEKMDIKLTSNIDRVPLL